MSKQLLIKSVAEQLGGTHADAERAVNAVATALNAVVGAGNAVRLPPLGGFALKHKNERRGVSPGSGEPYVVPAHDAIVFKQSKKG